MSHPSGIWQSLGPFFYQYFIPPGLWQKEFDIHPNWIFGYIGNDDEVMYMSNLIPESELHKKDKEIQELKLELGEAYKQLAEERRSK